jgi:hypothetical protein
LARITSSTRHPTGDVNAAEMLEESKFIIERTAGEAESEIASELVNIQIMV